MLEARGRFQVTILDEVVYAVGGSNGKPKMLTLSKSIIECSEKNEILIDFP